MSDLLKRNSIARGDGMWFSKQAVPARRPAGRFLGWLLSHPVSLRTCLVGSCSIGRCAVWNLIIALIFAKSFYDMPKRLYDNGDILVYYLTEVPVVVMGYGWCRRLLDRRTRMYCRTDFL